MVALPLRIDGEGGGFFLVKRAIRLPRRPGALEREVAADDIDDVIGGGDLLEGFLRDHFARSGQGTPT
jgi:hypothetical protein